MGSHSLPNVNKCNIYHFSKYFRQQFWTTEGLTEKEDETPLSHWGYHHDVLQFVFCRRKVNVSQFVSFIFSSKEVSKLNLFEAARCFIHKFLEWTLEVLMNLSPSATEQTYPSKWKWKLNLKKDSRCLTLLKIKMLFCHCSSTILFITCIKQSKEKTPFCPWTFPFVI